MKNFSNRLKLLREEKGLSQTELANLLYFDPSTISKYESGDVLPSLSALEKIAKFFNVKVHYLIGFDVW